MSLKHKFMALSAVMGLLMDIVAIVGYVMASRELNQSVDSELRATISREAMELWTAGCGRNGPLARQRPTT